MEIKRADPIMTLAEIQAALDRLDRKLPFYEDFSPEKFDALARKARLLRLRLTAVDPSDE